MEDTAQPVLRAHLGSARAPPRCHLCSALSPQAQARNPNTERLVPVREEIQMEVRLSDTSATQFSWQGNHSPENGKYSRSYS